MSSEAATSNCSTLLWICIIFFVLCTSYFIFPSFLANSDDSGRLKALASNSNHTSHPSSYNVAVCITGQAMRLEIETKLKNLVLHNLHLNPRVMMYVVAVLDEGKPSFSNVKSEHADCYAQDVNISQTLTNYFASTSRLIFQGHFAQSKDFVLSNDTLEVLDNYRKPNSTNTTAIIPPDWHDRVQNHMRQFYHDFQCLDKIRHLEHEHNTTMDVLIRIRDGSIVVKPFDIMKTMKMTNSQYVLTKNCNSWGGYADKFWITPKQYIEGTMGYLVNHTLSGKEYLKAAQPQTSEQLLKFVWDHQGVKAAEQSADVLPFVEGRCVAPANSSKEFPKVIQVPLWKDCRPKK